MDDLYENEKGLSTAWENTQEELLESFACLEKSCMNDIKISDCKLGLLSQVATTSGVDEIMDDKLFSLDYGAKFNINVE